MPAKAVVHKSGDGKAYRMLGGLWEVLLPSDKSGGRGPHPWAGPSSAP